MRSYGEISLTRIVAFAALGALVALAGLAATQAAPASAQQPPPGSPAFCAQYPNHPACIDDVIVPPGPVTPPGVPGAPGVDTAAAAPTAVAPAGTLPFTGYPITPLLLLLLILLVAGLTLRAYLAIRERIRERHAGPPGAA